MGAFWQDLRYGVRMLVRSPGFTAVAVLTLALGIGANTAIFGLLNALFLRPLPGVAARDLVWLEERHPDAARPLGLSWPDYVDYRDNSGVFSTLAAYHEIPMALADDGAPERVQGQIVTGNYFLTLGVGAAAGRLFTEQDDRASGASPVAVISHALWTRRFASDGSLPGRAVILNGQPFSIIGVTAEGFVGAELGSAADIWIPFAMQRQAVPSLNGMLESRQGSWLKVVGRPGAGLSLAQARAGAARTARRIEQDSASERRGVGPVLTPALGGLHPQNAVEAVPLVSILSVVTGLVLFIACFNVANLLLARGAARRREIAIRLALGATRGRLVRQLLAESMLLALTGAMAGLLLAAWVPDLLIHVAGAPADVARAVGPNLTVLLFTLALAAATGALTGLAPALEASRPDLTPVLKDETGGPILAGGRSRLQGIFVISQVALSLVLLVSAGLFLRSLGKAAAVDPGFDAGATASFSFDLPTQGYSREKGRVFCAELLERLRAVPGVRSATLASLAPLSGRMVGMPVSIEGAGGGQTDQPVVSANFVWPDYFATMGIPLVRGRDFTMQDREGVPGVLIINETMARRFFGDGEALGRRIRLAGDRTPAMEVIGVARDSRYDELTEDPRAFMYLPSLQDPGQNAVVPELTALVRLDGAPALALAALQREVRSMDPALPVFDVRTMAGMVRQRNDRQQAISRMLTVFGTLALFLATTGLYGVMAQGVSRRYREIGIRMALGARDADLVGMFVREGLGLAVIGIGIGSALALGLTRALSSMLFGVTPADLVTFAAVALLLAGVAAAASWLPIRRATRTEPMLSLRHD